MKITNTAPTITRLALALLPLALAAVSLALPVTVPAWTWVCAAIVAAGWLWAGWAWTRGDETTPLVVAPLAGAAIVAVLLAGVMPRVGEVMSARDLAAALNRGGRLPPELWVLRQRLGSVVFYLAPPLRAEATPQRIVQVQLSDLRRRAAPVGTMIAVAAQDLAKVAPFQGRPAPYVEAGHYRLYRAEHLGVPLRPVQDDGFVR